MADRNEYLEDPMWYVVHTYSGYENKVKTNIDKSIQNLHLEDQILDVQVPVQEVIEVKDGKKKTVQKKLFPGYVLLHMIMNDETWYVVRNTRGVTGFVGPESKPVPLTEEEMTAMGINMNDAEKDEPDQMILVDIEEGDMVMASSTHKGFCVVAALSRYTSGLLYTILDKIGKSSLIF